MLITRRPRSSPTLVLITPEESLPKQTHGNRILAFLRGRVDVAAKGPEAHGA